METTTLSGGCFWCLEAVYDQLNGVTDVVSGYAGGQVDNPTYKQVCSGRTGHADVVQVTFDPAVISFEDNLDVFFTIHDPTTLNRQGADVGTQYRSASFTPSTGRLYSHRGAPGKSELCSRRQRAEPQIHRGAHFVQTC